MLKVTKANCFEEIQDDGKILFNQSIVENGWWGGVHPSHPLPGSAPDGVKLSFNSGTSFGSNFTNKPLQMFVNTHARTVAHTAMVIIHVSYMKK